MAAFAGLGAGVRAEFSPEYQVKGVGAMLGLFPLLRLENYAQNVVSDIDGK